MVFRLISSSPRPPGLFATVAGGIASADLTPASGRQDHTTSPSASAPFVKGAARVHRIPPHVYDDRETPLREAGRVCYIADFTRPSSVISEIQKLSRRHRERPRWQAPAIDILTSELAPKKGVDARRKAGKDDQERS